MPLKPMTSDEIRSTYLEFFEARDHLRLPSASLIPAEHDPSVLFTIAGMVPFKPYFLGSERPPHPRVTTCQKTFRTVDIDIIGTTSRHLTFFEMLGNFSFGDYFKNEATRFAWELSTQGFGFPVEQIWVTVFGGDDELGLGPDRRGDRVVARDRRPAASGSSSASGLRTSGRRVRPGPAAPARSCTSIAASSSARPTTFRVATTSASSSIGTSCSCSSTRIP